MDIILEAKVYHYLTTFLEHKDVVVTKEPIVRMHYRAFIEGKEIITIKEEEPGSDFVSVYVTEKPFLYERKTNEHMQQVISICEFKSAKYLTDAQQIGLYTLESFLKRLK